MPTCPVSGTNKVSDQNLTFMEHRGARRKASALMDVVQDYMATPSFMDGPPCLEIEYAVRLLDKVGWVQRG